MNTETPTPKSDTASIILQKVHGICDALGIDDAETADRRVQFMADKLAEITTTNTGGPAFPTDSEGQIGPATYHFEGMTLRDYFAAAALTGIVASPDCASSNEQIAKGAFTIADCMIAERDKQNEH